MEYTSKQESQRLQTTLDFLLLNKQITPELKEEIISRDLARNKPDKPYYAWIGINPSGQTMIDLHNTAQKSLPYEDYIYSLEQNTENGIRPHIHCLAKVKPSTRPNAEIPRLAQLFKTNPQYIEFKISKSKKLKNQRLKYIYGEKKEEKLLNTEKDIKDRISLGLLNYYLKGNI